MTTSMSIQSAVFTHQKDMEFHAYTTFREFGAHKRK